jgi:hypothetical protein
LRRASIRGVPSIERSLLLAPDAIARAAAWMAREPEQRWMLCQPRAVRRSYVAEVIDRDHADSAEESWMLRQDEIVRESYIAQVLAGRRPPPREEIWMLRQDDAVRESYVREVVEAAGG